MKSSGKVGKSYVLSIKLGMIFKKKCIIYSPYMLFMFYEGDKSERNDTAELQQYVGQVLFFSNKKIYSIYISLQEC